MPPAPDRSVLQRRWSALHHGIDPESVPLLRGWLAVMWRVARPLVAMRVPPVGVTALGVVLALDAVLLAPRLPWAAGLILLVAAACDGLDGAVAVLAARATRLGARADAVADRITDAAFAAVLWRCGAPWPLAALAGALAVGVDLARRLRRRPALITVAERPSWTICAALACAAATVTTAAWPVTVCAVVWLVLGTLGLTQVLGLTQRTGRPFHVSRSRVLSRNERSVR